jgi:5-methyltetrahydrofolate--homocysteine methyltransferase
MEQVVQEIYEGVIEGQNTLVQQRVQEALEAGIDPAVLLNQGMIAAMAEVGKRFEEG